MYIDSIIDLSEMRYIPATSMYQTCCASQIIRPSLKCVYHAVQRGNTGGSMQKSICYYHTLFVHLTACVSRENLPSFLIILKGNSKDNNWQKQSCTYYLYTHACTMYMMKWHLSIVSACKLSKKQLAYVSTRHSSHPQLARCQNYYPARMRKG